MGWSLEEEREFILLAGDTFTGKTWAWIKRAERDFADPAHWTGEGEERQYTGPRYFVLDLDSTTPKYLGRNREFKHLYAGNGGNIYPYPCHDIETVRRALADIITNQRPVRGIDWIVWDTGTRFYREAQQFVGDIKGIILGQEAMNRKLSNQGFGDFETNGWQMVSLAHDTNVNSALNTGANVLMIVHITEYVGHFDNQSNTKQMLFSKLGFKPTGRPTLAQDADTIIVLWSEAHAGGAKRKFSVLKDRGETAYYERPLMGDDLFAAVDEARRNIAKPVNLPPDAIAPDLATNVTEEIEKRTQTAPSES